MRKGDFAARSHGDRFGGAKGRLFSTGLRNGSRARVSKYRKRLAAPNPAENYVAVVSHELRTPLTALRLQLDNALSAVKGPPEAHGHLLSRLESARRQVDRLVAMVDQLLDVSRLSAGKLELDVEPVDLMEVVREVVDRAGDQLARSRCEVVVEGPESVRGAWNRLGLEQVVTNLLMNASKYGGGKPIFIAVEADEKRATLRVTDGGIGIAEADQARIFERYEQVVGPRAHGGLGLGLWIVMRILRALGGRIHVESRLGEGATFVVELPRG